MELFELTDTKKNTVDINKETLWILIRKHRG